MHRLLVVGLISFLCENTVRTLGNATRFKISELSMGVGTSKMEYSNRSYYFVEKVYANFLMRLGSI